MAIWGIFSHGRRDCQLINKKHEILNFIPQKVAQKK